MTLLLSGTWTWETQTKTWKYLSDGVTPLHASSGVISLTAKVGLRFRTCTVQLTGSGHKVFGICFYESMLWTIFIMVLFFRSATPFCCGLYAAVNCLFIPFSLQKWLNSWYVNSPPLWVRTHLTYEPFYTILIAKMIINSPPLSVRKHLTYEPISFSTWIHDSYSIWKWRKLLTSQLRNKPKLYD